ncbi:hypothetical protein [Plantactinospora soyae]|uniref:Uncharacterized protein n=1 Tax=Plantactinospora soyae TaxID=1544732 RepID=A0A927MAE6_9ACTN|nr:hypothetical protein [Plantactinospora soyae]MBE1488228.1 hypothetical protein [Plantactinospora soyae]
MNRFVNPGRNGWLALLGGLVLGVVCASAFFRVATFGDSWMVLAVVALPCLFAAIPYRPNRPSALAPWRYFVLALGLTFCASSLIGS